MDDKHNEEFKKLMDEKINMYFDEVFKDFKPESKESATKRMLFEQLNGHNLN